MANARLDQRLLRKIAAKVEKSEKYVREQISRGAAKNGVAAEAFQICWATRLNLGTATFRRRQPPDVRDQVQRLLSSPAVSSVRRSVPPQAAGERGREAIDPVRASVDQLVRDPILKKWCARLLKGSGPFDTVIREATTVLDDRLKALGGIKGYMNPDAVVGKVLNPDPAKALLVVSSEPAEQRGFHAICSGLTLAFRGPSHHMLSDKITREDALKICVFVDAILRFLDQGKRVQPASASSPGAGAPRPAASDVSPRPESPKKKTSRPRTYRDVVGPLPRPDQGSEEPEYA